MNSIERLAPMRPEMKLPAMKPTGKAKNHRPMGCISAEMLSGEEQRGGRLGIEGGRRHSGL